MGRNNRYEVTNLLEQLSATKNRVKKSLPQAGVNRSLADIKSSTPAQTPLSGADNLRFVAGSQKSLGAGTANPQTPLASGGNKVLGMPLNNFVQLAGGLGNAIAPDTPMGRAGGFMANYAGQNIAREDKASEIARLRNNFLENREDKQTFETTAAKTLAGVAAEKQRKQNALTIAQNKTQNSLEDARTKISNDFILAKMAENNRASASATAAQRKWLSSKTDAANLREDSKDGMAYLRQLMAPTVDEETGETLPGLPAGDAMKYMAMQRHQLKLFQNPPPAKEGGLGTTTDGDIKPITDAQKKLGDGLGSQPPPAVLAPVKQTKLPQNAKQWDIKFKRTGLGSGKYTVKDVDGNYRALTDEETKAYMAAVRGKEEGEPVSLLSKIGEGIDSFHDFQKSWFKNGAM